MEKTAVQGMIDIVQMDMNNGVEISMEVFMGMLKQAKEMEAKQKGYSEEEVIEILLDFRGENPRYIEEWFEQFKKK